MVVTNVSPEVSNDESEVHPSWKEDPMVVTDVNPEVSKDESEVHPRRKQSPMVLTDVNPDVSKDDSEVQQWRKKDPMVVIFGAWIEHDTTCLQSRKKPSMISPSPSVSTR